MKLFEFEGKQLLHRAGIEIPHGKIVSSTAELHEAAKEFGRAMVKAQVLSGKRKKSGLIKACADEKEIIEFGKKLFEHKEKKIEKILLEQLLPVQSEYYLGITFSTAHRAPVAIACTEGGIDIEETKKLHPQKVVVQPIDLSKDTGPWVFREIASQAGFSGLTLVKVSETLSRVWDCFKSNGCLLAEINPLIHTDNDDFIAGDAKIEIDSDALKLLSHINFPPRSSFGKEPSQRELDARKIDKNDHRGVCGSSYIDLEGDIAIIAAGGGASLTCMDSLVACGGKPANFVEHSGNPPAYKLERLTKIVLSKPGINGLWFVGGTANFTDIFETLKGFLDGLRSINPKPTYPIVIRRGGPRDAEAFEMLKKAKEEESFDFTLFGSDTSMTSTAKVIVEKVQEYKKSKHSQQLAKLPKASAAESSTKVSQQIGR